MRTILNHTRIRNATALNEKRIRNATVGVVSAVIVRIIASCPWGASQGQPAAEYFLQATEPSSSKISRLPSTSVFVYHIRESLIGPTVYPSLRSTQKRETRLCGNFSKRLNCETHRSTVSQLVKHERNDLGLARGYSAGVSNACSGWYAGEPGQSTSSAALTSCRDRSLRCHCVGQRSCEATIVANPRRFDPISQRSVRSRDSEVPRRARGNISIHRAWA